MFKIRIMKKIIYTLFVLPLFFSCAKNGEYKKCNDYFESLNKEEGYWDGRAEIIMKENPNSEVCRIENYKDDKIMSSKYYVDNKLIYETKRIKAYSGPDGEKITYNKKGDTLSHVIVGENYKYSKDLIIDEKTNEITGSEVRVSFQEVKGIKSLYAKYNNNGKLIFEKSGCINEKRVNDWNESRFCDCPTENINKYVLDFNKKLAEAKKQQLNREIDAFVDKTINR